MSSKEVAIAPEAAEHYLRALRPEVRRRLVESLGVSARSGRRLYADAAQAMTSKDTLRRLVAALGTDARGYLYTLAGGGERELRISDIDTVLVDGRGWTRDRCDAARRELSDAGLAAGADSAYGHASLAPGLVAAVDEDSFDWIAGAVAGEAPPPSNAFVLAVIAAYCAEDPPRLRSEGGIYVKWPEKCAARLGNPAVSIARAEAIVSFLGRLGVLTEFREDGRRTLAVTPSTFDAAFAQRPADLALASVAAAHDAAVASRIALGVMARAGRGAATGSAIGRTALVAACGEFREVAERTLSHDVREHAGDETGLAHGLRFLTHAGLVAVHLGDGEPRFERIEPADHGDGRWIVQPNFEVLVPEDTPPAAVARLGLVASVVRLDRVATFEISRESIERGLEAGAEAADPLALLASRAATPIPENVAATVRGWAKSTPRIRPYTGSVLVAESDEQAAFLRGSGRVMAEIAPRVFHLADADLPDVVASAIGAGHVSARVRTAVKSNAAAGGAAADDLGERAARTAAGLRARVSEWTAFDVTRPRRKADADLRRPGGLLTLDTNQIWVFRAKYPRLFRALKGSPSLMALAHRLGPQRLTVFEREGGGRAFEDALFDLSLDLVAPVPGDARAGSHGPHGPGCDCDADDDEHDDEHEVPRPAARLANSAAPPRLPPPPTARPTAAPRAPAASGAGRPWETPAPGELRRRIAESAMAGARIEILYMNSQGVQTARVVTPVGVRDGARVSVDARPADAPGTASFLLDRIAAIRPAT